MNDSAVVRPRSTVAAEVAKGKDVGKDQWFGGTRNSNGANIWQNKSWSLPSQEEILERFAYKYFNWRY
jgi:hypothetical protein